MIRIDRLDDVRARRSAAGRLYEEYLRVPSMSAGVYELAAGSVDPQQPHAQDELYLVVGGRATFTAAGERHRVGPGDSIFVPAGVMHRFEDVIDDLTVVVVFAPPET